jgi:hypothetical protein
VIATGEAEGAETLPPCSVDRLAGPRSGMRPEADLGEAPSFAGNVGYFIPNGSPATILEKRGGQGN